MSRKRSDQIIFHAADLLAAMGMTALFAGLFLGAVVGFACLVAQAIAPVSAVVAHAVLRAGSHHGRPSHG